MARPLRARSAPGTARNRPRVPQTKVQPPPHAFFAPQPLCATLCTWMLIAFARRTAVIRAPVLPQADPQRWFEPGSAEPNESEILFFALVTVASKVDTAKRLHEWAVRVHRLAAQAEEQRAAWKPPGEELGGWRSRNGVSEVFSYLEQAIRNTPFADAELDCMGAVMQLWDGPGQRDNLRSVQLRTHLGKKDAPLLCARVKGQKSASPPRWRSWHVVRVATLIKDSGSEMCRTRESGRDGHCFDTFDRWRYLFGTPVVAAFLQLTARSMLT